MCEESLCTNINTDNVLGKLRQSGFCRIPTIFLFPDMLVLSDLHGASSVRALALKFIVENGKEIVAQNGWRDKLKVGSTFTNRAFTESFSFHFSSS